MSNILNVSPRPVFSEVDEIDPLELVGNARLALHHHMAPAGSLDELEEAQELSKESHEKLTKETKHPRCG